MPLFFRKMTHLVAVVIDVAVTIAMTVSVTVDVVVDVSVVAVFSVLLRYVRSMETG